MTTRLWTISRICRAPDGEGGAAPAADPAGAPPSDVPSLDGVGDAPADGGDAPAPSLDGIGEGGQQPQGPEQYRGAPEVADGDYASAYGEFTVPEGFEAVDDKALGEFLPLAKELDLSKDGVQKLVEFEARQRLAMTQWWADQKSEWATTAKADPEIGGPTSRQTMDVVTRAYTAKTPDGRPIVTPELRQTLQQFGLTQHPEVIRMFARLGSIGVGQSDDPARGKPAAAPKSIAERLYPNLPSAYDVPG